MSSFNNPNSEKSAHKVIQVRPIHEFVPQETDKQKLSEDDEKKAIQVNIEAAKEELASLEKQRTTLLNELHKQIEHEKSEWEHEKKTEMAHVKQEAYKVGFGEGKEASLKEYRDLIMQANSLVDAATKEYHSTIEQYEQAIIDLSMKVAEKILIEKLTEKPEYFLPIVQGAIEDLKDYSHISIYLNPDNYQFVLDQKDELTQSLEEDSSISLYIDETLDKNSCLINHPTGKIDASVDTQLREIKTILNEVSMENTT